MNPETGFIERFDNKDMAEEQGYIVDVLKEEFTKLQEERFNHDIQPVVLPKDTRSKLSKKAKKARDRLTELKEMALAIDLRSKADEKTGGD